MDRNIDPFLSIYSTDRTIELSYSASLGPAKGLVLTRYVNHGTFRNLMLNVYKKCSSYLERGVLLEEVC